MGQPFARTTIQLQLSPVSSACSLPLPVWAMGGHSSQLLLAPGGFTSLCDCPQSCHTLRTVPSGFPGGAVVENLPANAGDMGSSPGLGRSHMPRSNWAREPQLLSLRIWSLCSATREAVIVRGPRTAMKSGPRLRQLEKALAQKRRPNTAKNK